MEVKRLRTLAIEIFKAFKEKSPSFIKDYFEKNENSVSRKHDLKIPVRNSVTFGDKSLRCLAPRVWNSLPLKLKTENSYEKFKEEINKWFGPTCKCSLCSYMNSKWYKFTCTRYWSASFQGWFLNVCLVACIC